MDYFLTLSKVHRSISNADSIKSYTLLYTVEKVCDVKYYVKLYTALLLFSFPNVTFLSMFQFLVTFGMGFEVLTVERIHVI